MRRFVIAFFALTLMFGGISAIAYAADCTKDTAFDKVWDWATTLGKQGMEKDKILVKNKADRVARLREERSGKGRRSRQKGWRGHEEENRFLRAKFENNILKRPGPKDRAFFVTKGPKIFGSLTSDGGEARPVGVFEEFTIAKGAR